MKDDVKSLLVIGLTTGNNVNIHSEQPREWLEERMRTGLKQGEVIVIPTARKDDVFQNTPQGPKPLWRQLNAKMHVLASAVLWYEVHDIESIPDLVIPKIGLSH